MSSQFVATSPPPPSTPLGLRYVVFTTFLHTYLRSLVYELVAQFSTIFVIVDGVFIHQEEVAEERRHVRIAGVLDFRLDCIDVHLVGDDLAVVGNLDVQPSSGK